MKAVMADVPEEFLEARRKTGADRYDEMWEGVLHMPPMPNRAHQELVLSLASWLRSHWAATGHGRVYHEINVASVGGWPKNYRIPDVVILKPDRYFIDRNEFFEGAPTIVVEVVSPGDESYDKMPFYAALGVPEVWMVHRDTREPEIWTLEAGQYVQRSAGAGGWLASGEIEVSLKPSQGQLLARLGPDGAETAL